MLFYSLQSSANSNFSLFPFKEKPCHYRGWMLRKRLKEMPGSCCPRSVPFLSLHAVAPSLHSAENVWLSRESECTSAQPNSLKEFACRYQCLFYFYWEHFDKERDLYVCFSSLGVIKRSLLHRYYPSFNSKKVMKLKATTASAKQRCFKSWIKFLYSSTSRNALTLQVCSNRTGVRRVAHGLSAHQTALQSPWAHGRH